MIPANLEKLPLKRRLEEVAAHIWISGRVERDSIEFDNVWSLHELASKTHFRDTYPILDTINKTLSCVSCKDVCSHLIMNREHMPVDLFEAEACCLYNWKVEMRSSHAFVSDHWPLFDRTIAIVKPDSDPATVGTIEEQLGDEAVVEHKEVQLLPQDVAFLYTSAYGMSYVRDLIAYMTSGVSIVLLINKKNIGNVQDAIKKKVRSSTQQKCHLKNNVHFPDSFHESFAQVAYFFGSEYGSRVHG